jgi:hypothetical protein
LILIYIYFRAKRRNELDQQYNEVVQTEGPNDYNEIETTMQMENILKWNETVVRDFLMKKDLSDLMYRSLKSELLDIHEKVLPISTFLHFIHRLRIVDNNDIPLNMYIYTEHLPEHSQDDE